MKPLENGSTVYRANMARSGFLNENTSVDYPFIHGQADALPKFAISDFGCVTMVGSGYLAGEHAVYLYQLRRTGSLLEFEFHSDAPGLSELCLLFRRDITDPRFVSEYVEAVLRPSLAEASSLGEEVSGSSSSDDSSSLACPFDPLWSGFMVSGDMAMLTAVLADGAAIDGPRPVEPSRIQSLDGGYLRSLGIANAERTRATRASECRDYCWATPLQDYYIVCECLIGDIRFAPGYNAAVRLEARQNQIVIGAEVGGGLGEPCDDVQLFPGEAPPLGSDLFTGGLRCNDVIRNINGIGGQFLSIGGGSGVTVTALPNTHRLIIDVDLHALALCPDLPEAIPSEPLADNTDPCNCGPAS